MNMYKLFGCIINRIRKQVTKLILIRFLFTLGNVGFAWFRHFPKRGFWNKHEHTELVICMYIV
jgi:hypothetical protein